MLLEYIQLLSVRIPGGTFETWTTWGGKLVIVESWVGGRGEEGKCWRLNSLLKKKNSTESRLWHPGETKSSALLGHIEMTQGSSREMYFGMKSSNYGPG